MAAYVQDTVQYDTATGNKSSTITPAVGGLLVVFISESGIATPGTVADNQGGTYTQITSCLRNASGSYGAVYVRTALAASAVAHIVTMTTGGVSTGGGLNVIEVSGMTRAGASAVRQSAKADNVASGATPAPTFASSCLTGNMTLASIIAQINPTACTTPTGWTRRRDIGYTVPAAGLQTNTRDSGFTGTAITYGSTIASIHGSMALELDTTSPTTTVSVSTAGAVTFTGQSVALVQSQGITAGQITFTGQTVTLITGGGTTTVVVSTAGAVAFTGQSVAFRQTQALTAGAITFAGQTVTGLTVVGVTSGAVAFTGQSVAFRQTQSVVAGAITFTGQTVTTTVAVIVSVTTSGAVVLTGQSVAFTQRQNVTAGAMTFAGQTVTPLAAVIVSVTTAGQVTVAGQSIAFKQTQNVTGGAITFTGQIVAIVRMVPVTAGQLAFTGQAVGLKLLLTLGAGAVTFNGSTLTLVATGSTVLVVTAGAITFTGQTVTAGAPPTGVPVVYFDAEGPYISAYAATGRLSDLT